MGESFLCRGVLLGVLKKDDIIVCERCELFFSMEGAVSEMPPKAD